MSISPELKKMMRALEAAFGSGMPIDYQVGIDRDGGGAELWEIDPEAYQYPDRPTFRVEGYSNEEEAFLALAAQIAEAVAMFEDGSDEVSLNLHPMPLSKEKFWRMFGKREVADRGRTGQKRQDER